MSERSERAAWAIRSAVCADCKHPAIRHDAAGCSRGIGGALCRCKRGGPAAIEAAAVLDALGDDDAERRGLTVAGLRVQDDRCCIHNETWHHEAGCRAPECTCRGWNGYALGDDTAQATVERVTALLDDFEQRWDRGLPEPQRAPHLRAFRKRLRAALDLETGP